MGTPGNEGSEPAEQVGTIETSGTVFAHEGQAPATAPGAPIWIPAPRAPGASCSAVRGVARHARLALGLRAVRSLIAADAAAGPAPLDHSERARRVLAAFLDATDLRAAIWLRPGWTAESAAAPVDVGFGATTPAALAASDAARGGLEDLAELALREGRPCIIAPRREHAAVAWLRQEVPGLTGVVVIPLTDLGEPAGTLVAIADHAAACSPLVVQAMSPGIRLLAILLTPGRGSVAQIRSAKELEGQASTEAERLALEVEDLRLRLAEAEDVAREAEEQKAATTRALQTEVDTLRGRLGHLESEATHRGLELEVRRGDDEVRVALEEACTQRDRRIGELETALAEALARSLEATRRTAELEESLAAAQREAAPGAANGLDDSGLALTHPGAEPGGFGLEDPEILELAGEAALALEREPVDGEAGLLDARTAPATAAGGGVAEAPAPADEPEWPVEVPLGGAALIAAETDVELAAALVEAAGQAGASVWDGADQPGGPRAAVVAVNLVGPELARLAGVAAGLGGLVRTVAYAWDAESRTGFLVGHAEVLERPIDPARAVAQLKRSVPGKLERVMIVSATLRELSGFRDALATAGVSSSIACDARQALELLDIVKRPDAFVVDLALSGGDGFALAALTQAKPDLAQATMGLLLPAEIDPETLRRGMVRAASDSCFGAADLKRTVGHALAVLAQRLED